MIKKDLKRRISTSIILLALIVLIFEFKIILVFSLIILGVISIMEFLKITKKIIKNNLLFFCSNILFIIYIFLFCLIFLLFSHTYILKLFLFSLLLGCIASDIGGFVFGKIFKGPKLTEISPNKTISGAIGAVFFTCLTISILFFSITHSFNLKILFIGVVNSLACQIGDLFFSYLKRKAKIKDTGNFLPGHGGVLDRLDGILLGIPIGLITIITFLK